MNDNNEPMDYTYPEPHDKPERPEPKTRMLKLTKDEICVLENALDELETHLRSMNYDEQEMGAYESLKEKISQIRQEKEK